MSPLSELPFAPQGPISASVSSLPAPALQGRCCPSPRKGRCLWAGHRVTLGAATTSIPSSHTFISLSSHLWAGAGEWSCCCARGAPNPHPNRAWPSLARVWFCLLALPDRFQSSRSFQESSPFLLLQLWQELDDQALGMAQIFACVQQQTLPAQVQP